MARFDWKKELWSWVQPVAFALTFTTFGASAVGVDGVSMTPSLRHGERLLIPRYETWLHRAGIGSFERGDIVVFKPPKSPAVAQVGIEGVWTYTPYFVKRVVGVPGDRVRLERGRVFVNGRQLDPAGVVPYWRARGCLDETSAIANNALSRLGTSTEDWAVPVAHEVVVPEGHYFVMGDNRDPDGSIDSRMFGPVPLERIAGRAAAVVWPLVRTSDVGYDCATDQATGTGERVLGPRLLTH